MTTTHTRKLVSVTQPVDMSVDGLVPPRSLVERKSVVRGVYIESIKYHGVTEQVTPRSQTIEPPGLQAVLDSAVGVTGISKRLMERLRDHFSGVEVSPLKSGPCQVAVVDDHDFEAQ